MGAPQEIVHLQNGTFKGYDRCITMGGSTEEALDCMAKILCMQHGKDDGFCGKNRAAAAQCMATTLLAREFEMPTAELLDINRLYFLN